MSGRHLLKLSLCWCLLIVLAGSAAAENQGQDDLDKATQLKITAETLNDLNEVIDLLETSLEKGLDEGNAEFARQMLVSSLVQRGSLFSAAMFNVPPEDPQRRLRSMQFRQFALSDLQRAVELDEQLWDAHLLIGKLQSLGDPNAARRALSRVVDAPDVAPEQRAEALALRGTVGRDEEKQLDDLNRAVELQPENPNYVRLRAQYLFGKEKFDEALADIDRALELEPEHVDSNELRGMILLGLEKYDEALASFDRSTELLPEAVLPYQYRGELYRQKGDLEKAIQQLTKALELAPENVATLLVRAGVYYELEQPDRALEDLEQAIRIQPQLLQPHLMKVEIYAATDRLDEAVAELERLVQAAPGNVQLLNRLATFHLMTGRPRKAIETFSRVIEQDSENFAATRLRGDSYLNIGQHAEAIADFEQAIQLSEDDESLLNNFAWVLATSPDDELRDGERALKLATKAAELSGYEMPHILSTLGAAYAETGDFESAKKWSQKAVELAQKAVDAAETDEERTKLETDLEQLQQELDSYEDGEPVRERQTTEEAPETPPAADT